MLWGIDSLASWISSLDQQHATISYLALFIFGHNAAPLNKNVRFTVTGLQFGRIVRLWLMLRNLKAANSKLFPSPSSVTRDSPRWCDYKSSAETTKGEKKKKCRNVMEIWHFILFHELIGGHGLFNGATKIWYFFASSVEQRFSRSMHAMIYLRNLFPFQFGSEIPIFPLEPSVTFILWYLSFFSNSNQILNLNQSNYKNLNLHLLFFLATRGQRNKLTSPYKVDIGGHVSKLA